jgi:cytochrome c5
MSRRALPICAVVVSVLAPLHADAATPVQLKSLSVNLPATGRMFSNGPGADAINSNCLACHSVDMVLNQPRMSKTAWEAEVNKMRNVYKAPVDAKDVPAIVDYLVRIKGTK